MKKHKIAIIGTGNIANFHVPALRATGFNIVACTGKKNSKTAHEFSAKHNIPSVTNGLDELINNFQEIYKKAHPREQNK